NLVDARMSFQDLITAVKSGSMHSQDLLVDHLSAFSSDAKKVSKGLQRFMVKVHGAADRILAVNEYTLSTIDARRNASSNARWLCDITGDRLPTDTCRLSRQMKDAFGMGVRQFEASTGELLRLAADLDLGFNRLDDHLDTIRDIVAHAANLHITEKEELLAGIWVRLGGNRRALAELKTRGKTLKSAILYHNKAHRYVTGAYSHLVGMEAELDGLRTFANEALTGSRGLEIEVLADTISRGVERLQQGQRVGRD
ncbi:hypothetical protein BV25DRAFT_1776639, partial [Artomyces pyxidatus]